MTQFTVLMAGTEGEALEALIATAGLIEIIWSGDGTITEAQTLPPGRCVAYTVNALFDTEGP